MKTYQTSNGLAQTTSGFSRRAFLLVGILKIGSVLFTLLTLVALLLPAVSRSRPAARHAVCKNNLKQISLGIENYKSSYGVYPPAYTTDAAGNRLHSWRALILPFVDGRDVYEKIDFSKPWDAPENAAAREDRVACYFCAMSNGVFERKTTYLANVASNSVLRSPDESLSSSINPAEAASVVVIEVPNDQAIHWMSPEDSPTDFINHMTEYKNLPHYEGVQLVLKNGTVYRLNPRSVTERERQEMFGHAHQPRPGPEATADDAGTVAIQRSAAVQAN